MCLALTIWFLSGLLVPLIFAKDEEMICGKCKRPVFDGSMDKNGLLCICQFGGDRIVAAAWHAVQKDLLLRDHREQVQLSLPFESPAEMFNRDWATYKNGQHSMLEAILTYLRNLGYNGLADRVKQKFDDGP